MNKHLPATVALLLAACGPTVISAKQDSDPKATIQHSTSEKETKSNEASASDSNAVLKDTAASSAKSGDKPATASDKKDNKQKPAVVEYEKFGEPYNADVSGSGVNKVQLTLKLAEATCYRFAVGVEKELKAEKFVIYDEDKKTLLLDVKEPPAQQGESVCLSKAGERSAEVSVNKGPGKVAVQVYKQKPQIQVATPSEPMSPSQQELKNFAQAVAEGQFAVSPMYTMNAPPADANFMVKLERSACYNFVAAAGKEVEEVHLALIEPSGHKVLEDKAPASKKHFTYCVESSGLYRATFQVIRGSGEIAFQVYQSPTRYIPRTRTTPPLQVTPGVKQTAPQTAQTHGVWPSVPRL